MRNLIFVFILIPSLSFLTVRPLIAFDHSHADYQLVLNQSVFTSGAKSRVDYTWLKDNDSLLKSYTIELSSVTKSDYSTWNKSQQLAFLINAYNALTLQLILTRYPDLTSIKDLGSLFSSPWKKSFFVLLGDQRHLDFIEHEMIRKEFAEPRIHFAVVCASIGCPPLARDAFVAEQLDEQLERATRNFLSDKDRNRVNLVKKRLELSRIFKWFAEDFEKAAGSVQSYVTPYLTEADKLFSENRIEKVPITYLPYDWSLNDTLE